MEKRGWSRSPLLVATAALLCAFVVAGCSSDDSDGGPGPQGPVGPVGPVGDETGIAGSGSISSEPRDVSGFDEILFRSEGTVIVTAGDTASLVVESDDNLQQLLEASVKGRVLEISTTPDTDIAPSDPPVFRVGVASIAAIELAGAGAIEVDVLETDRLAITLSGAGDVTIGRVMVGELSVDLTGVGKVSLTGTADRQEARVGGVTTYDAANLESRAGTVEGTGTGQATIWVTGDLTVVASDASSVSYYGTPAVTQTISGAATITSLGAK